MSHLVPFVEVSRRKIREAVTNEIKLCNGDLNKVNDIVEARLKKEINKGIQTIQYQVVTIMTTNGWLLGRYKTA